MANRSTEVSGHGEGRSAQATEDLDGPAGIPESGTLADPMSGVRAQRSRASAQNAQTMRSWGSRGRVHPKAEPGPEDAGRDPQAEAAAGKGGPPPLEGRAAS